MAGNVTKRNGLIDLERFVFSIFIVLLHSENYRNSIMPNGYIAVEFFLVLSGYLLAKKAEEYQGTNLWNDNVRLVLHKFLSFFPFLLLSVIWSGLLYSVLLTSSSRFFITMALSFSDIFPVQMLGYFGIFISGVSWYLSVLLVGTFLLFPILVKKRDVFIKYLAPLFVLFAYGYIEKKQGCFQLPDVWYGVIYSGMLRGIAGLSLGAISYEIRKVIDSVKPGKLNKMVISAASVVIIALTVMFSLLGEVYIKLEAVFLPLMLLLIALSFSQHNVLASACSGKICGFLGKLSLSVYLCHYYTANLIPLFVSNGASNQATIVYLSAVMAFALANYFVGKLLINRKTRWFTAVALTVLVIIIIILCK